MNMHLSPEDPASRKQAIIHRLPQAFQTSRRPWLMAAIAILALVLFIWFLVQRASSSAPLPDANPLPVVTVTVPGLSEVMDSVTANGSISARKDMPVGVQGEGGRVTAIHAEAGQFVKAGQVLAEIDSSVQRAQLQQLQASVLRAEADERFAQAELDRAEKLVDRGFISRADIDRRTATRDSARAQVAMNRAQVRELQERIAQLSIRAPEAGLVLQRAIEPGQVVTPGSDPLFRVAAGGQMELRARVAEQDMPQLKVGQTANITPVGSDAVHVGRIWLLEPLIDPETRQGMARILVPAGPDVRAGGFARVTIDGTRAMKPVVQQSAIIVDGEENFVYIINEEDVVERRPVTIGTISPAGFAINSGLTGNERVVTLAGTFLRPGEKVRPVAEGAADTAPAAPAATKG